VHQEGNIVAFVIDSLILESDVRCNGNDSTISTEVGMLAVDLHQTTNTIVAISGNKRPGIAAYTCSNERRSKTAEQPLAVYLAEDRRPAPSTVRC